MTTLATAASLLRLFGKGRADIGVSEAAAALGMSKSTVSRALRSMATAGLVDAVGTSKRFRPGALLLAVAARARSSSPLIERASADVARLAAATGHTGYVSVRQGRDVIGIAESQGTAVLRVAPPIGQRLPLEATATGRALLARLSNDEVRAVLGAALRRPSPHAPRSFAELFARLDVIRAKGVAESHDEANRGVGALAVAVADEASGDAVALCIVYPAAIITAAEKRRMIAGLVAARRALEPGRAAVHPSHDTPALTGT